uniref:Uncharacterized protein n=1 Tax=Salix viminalis TaxID=40686 RepID=A0A6N2JYS9_SALVM
MTALAALLHQSKARDQRLAITSLPGPWVLSLTAVADGGRDKLGLSSSAEGGADHVHILSADCLEIQNLIKCQLMKNNNYVRNNVI